MIQFVNLYVRQSYTLTFYAKRTGSADIWVQILNGGGFENSPSFSSSVSGAYTKLSYSFVARGLVTGQVMSYPIYLIAGSAPGTVWFDSIEILGDEVFAPNFYLETKNNATIYKHSTGGNDNFGRFPEGCKFIFDRIENGKVRIKFGNKKGETTPAYLDFNDCNQSTVGVQTSRLYRITSIAQSLVNVRGENLGLGGDYCQNFIYWLCGATGFPPSEMPYPTEGAENYEKCGPAMQYFQNVGRFRSGHSTFTYGGLVYYEALGEDGEVLEGQSSHVGLIVGLNSNDHLFSSIEGNVNDDSGTPRVRLVAGDMQTGVNLIHGKKVLGMAIPNWDS